MPTKKGRDYIKEVVIRRGEKALIPAKIKHKMCKSLIDTGASQSCISEKNYNEMQLSAEIFAIKVTSANGAPINVWGTTKCPVNLGNAQYTHTFMVCKNIKRPMILGLDFLRKYRIGQKKGSLGYKPHHMKPWNHKSLSYRTNSKNNKENENTC